MRRMRFVGRCEFDGDGGVGDGLAGVGILDEHADVDRAGAERVGRREDGELVIAVLLHDADLAAVGERERRTTGRRGS